MNTPTHLKTFALIPLLGITLLSCSGSDSQNQGPRGWDSGGEGVIPAVEAIQARYGSLPLVERFSGNVRSENQVPLFPQISARVEAVYVENGDYVEKGEALVKLNDDQLQQQLQQAQAGAKINNARLKQAKAQLNELQSQYKRVKQLADKELSSEMELEQIEARLASAEADVELAEAQLEQSESLVAERKEQLSRTVVRAPVTGNVGQRNAQVGMQVSPNTQLFVIGDLSQLRVEIVLTENMLNKISVGQTATILVEDGEGNLQTIEASLSRISPFLNETTRSTEAEIDVKNENGWLKPGMFVPVDIHFGESEQATLVPTSAIFTDPTSGEEGVFVASALGTEIEPVSDTNATDTPQALTEPTQVEFKPINVIARGRMEVGVGGLESGQWVVTLGQDLLAEGRNQARVRTITWEKIMRLQMLQREDLLKEVMQEKNPPNVTL